LPDPQPTIARTLTDRPQEPPVAAANNPLTPELCRVFVTLERLDGALGATARALGDSTANLSKRVRPLLHGCPPHVPLPWLVKDGKRFRLTDEGRSLLPVAKDLAEKWEQFASFAAAGRVPGLTVACGQEAAGGVVLDAARAFRTHYPDSRFRVAVARGHQRIVGVAGGQYDIALVTHSKNAIAEIARRELSIRPLSADDLVLACAAKSEWAAPFGERSGEVEFAELRNLPLVLPEADSPIRRQWDEKVLRQSDAPSNVAVEVGGWRVLLGYVLAGFGVGLMPESVAREAGKKVLWRPLPHTLRPGNQVFVITLPAPTNAEMVAGFLKGLV